MMPAKNSERFIAEAIGSVKLQSFQNIELLVCNDGSNDGTGDVIRKSCKNDSRIRLFENAISIGIPRTRNRLLYAARGELMCHVDADDFISETAIECMVEYFRDYPSIAFAYSDRITVNAEGKKISEKATRDFDRRNLVYLGWNHLGMYRTHIARDVGGYNERQLTCTDGSLFMRIAELFPCMRVPAFLYAYRSHSTNIGHTRKKCDACPQQGVCDYYRIWNRSLTDWKKQHHQ